MTTMLEMRSDIRSCRAASGQELDRFLAAVDTDYGTGAVRVVEQQLVLAGEGIALEFDTKISIENLVKSAEKAGCRGVICQTMQVGPVASNPLI